MLERKGVPFWPDAAWRDVVFGAVVILAVVALAWFFGPPGLDQPPDPSLVNAHPRPDWYFLWYFALLALMPHGLEDYVIILGPLLVGLALLALPLVASRGERSPRRRPWAVATVVGVAAIIGALTVAGRRAAWSPAFDAGPLPAAVVASERPAGGARGRPVPRPGLHLLPRRGRTRGAPRARPDPRRRAPDQGRADHPHHERRVQHARLRVHPRTGRDRLAARLPAVPALGGKCLSPPGNSRNMGPAALDRRPFPAGKETPMTRIYTRTGDAGETSLGDGSRVAKNQARVDLYGDVDELNSTLGCAAAALRAEATGGPMADLLARIQSRLFDLGTVLANPKLSAGEHDFEAAELEHWIDGMDAYLSPLANFILPGGSSAAAMLHLARAVCRRAERKAVALAAVEPVPRGAVVYLNRLSDALFTAARAANAAAGVPDVPWRKDA